MVNLLPFLHFFAFLVYLYLLLFLLWKDSSSLLNRVCSAFIASLVIWSFGLTFFYVPGILKDTAKIFNNISAMGWISFASLFLWFTLIFTEKKILLKKHIIYPMLFIIPIVLIYKHWTGFMVEDYIQRSWGWSKILSPTIWNYLFYVYYLLFTIGALYLIYDFGKKIKDPMKKKQARIIFLTTLITLIIGTFNEVILPEIGIIKIPSIANIVSFIWAGGLVYAIAKYSLMTITPVAAADKIISTMIDSLILLNQKGRIITANEALLDLSGYPKNELTGKSIGMFFKDKEFKTALIDKSFKKEVIKNYELNLKTKKGNFIPVLFSSSAFVKEGVVKGIVCIIKDISERKEMDEKIKELIQFDELTGSYNRRYGLELVERQIKLANRDEASLLLAFFDIDNLKKINDAYGHSEGDWVLKAVINLIKSIMREVDIICRMGGDEFLLAVVDSSLKEAPLIRKRVNEKLAQLNHKIEKDYQIQFSIGFVEYSPSYPRNLEELIGIADQEMYKEKNKKRNNS